MRREAVLNAMSAQRREGQGFGVVSWSKCKVEPLNESSKKHAHLHESNGLAGTGIRSRREGDECFATQDQFRPTRPPLGDETIWKGKVARIYTIEQLRMRLA